MNKILFITLNILLSSALAETDITPYTIKENYSENIQVTGDFLVGIQTGTDQERKSIHVFLPDKPKGILCITLSSIDGKYKARIEKTINESLPNPVPIPYESKYKEIIDKYPNNEIAVLSTLGTSCDNDANAKQLISAWDATSRNLLLLIRSSARKDIAYITSQNLSAVKSKCRKFRKSYNVTYDKYCLFENINIGDIKEIEIVRNNLQPITNEIIKIN